MHLCFKYMYTLGEPHCASLSYTPNLVGYQGFTYHSEQPLRSFALFKELQFRVQDGCFCWLAYRKQQEVRESMCSLHLKCIYVAIMLGSPYLSPFLGSAVDGGIEDYDIRMKI